MKFFAYILFGLFFFLHSSGLIQLAVYHKADFITGSFPCAGHNCGCLTAEQCEVSCCCYPKEKDVSSCCESEKPKEDPIYSMQDGCSGKPLATLLKIQVRAEMKNNGFALISASKETPSYYGFFTLPDKRPEFPDHIPIS